MILNNLINFIDSKHSLVRYRYLNLLDLIENFAFTNLAYSKIIYISGVKQTHI